MNRTISPALTMVYKFIFPAVWIGLFGFGTVVMLLRGRSEAWRLASFLIVGVLAFGLGCFPLKRVAINGSDLLVSNFLRTIRVPLSNICNVTESRLINIHPVWIHFEEPTKFGRKIMFMPRYSFLACFCSHPIVAELKTLAGKEGS